MNAGGTGVQLIGPIGIACVNEDGFPGGCNDVGARAALHVGPIDFKFAGGTDRRRKGQDHNECIMILLVVAW